MGVSDTFPEEKLPATWFDDVKMNALFAPYRIKSANPQSWDMKTKFWSEMVRQWCKWKNNPIVTAADAKYAFQRNGRTPACLEVLVEEMLNNRELSPITKYQQYLHNGPEGWVRWGARMAFKPAALALMAVTAFMPEKQLLDSYGMPKASIEPSQRFVLESCVKEQAMRFLQEYPTDSERTSTIDHLMRTSGFIYGRETFEILLGYLISQGYAVKKGDVIKLGEVGKRASSVTETDEALVRLVSAENKLTADSERLAKEISNAETDARAALKLGNRLGAKNHLRRKLKLGQRMAKCEAALDNVRHLLATVRDVEVNSTIVDTYRMSSDALKKGMKDEGLDEESIFNTLDDLKEVLESYSDVEKALAGNTDDVDVAELEEELKELLATPGPSTPGGATEKKKNSEGPKPNVDRPTSARKISEKDFIFDGEERMMAELNDLSTEDVAPKDRGDRERVPLKEQWSSKEAEPKPKPSKSWYPPASQSPKSERLWSNNNLDKSLQDLNGSFAELHLDNRIHPGQPLELDFAKPQKLYNTDFQVQDHKRLDSGVWLYNSRDGNSNVDTGLMYSTEYFSPESPGKSGGSFQMAPGGERKKQSIQHDEDDIGDLEKRLKSLRGFN